jgi:hypothetical protein
MEYGNSEIAAFEVDIAVSRTSLCALKVAREESFSDSDLSWPKQLDSWLEGRRSEVATRVEYESQAFKKSEPTRLATFDTRASVPQPTFTYRTDNLGEIDRALELLKKLIFSQMNKSEASELVRLLPSLGSQVTEDPALYA